ncbi:MAG: 3-isopropylmalate dehydratase small subunit [Desulfobacterium sp.]|nr:3-isopropylmalate dehydratase small subunit [Desulfobacterium sp.]MBU3947361.1 3-isopropylmalate dehydratase small subunit [Pseudomonadota bacterium]MBU4037601.1 3-isopropylmalate dehydratase small subunit [Pseudomonadota bacterium]
MKNFSGKVLFLNRSDINTDEIIPARYLTENTKEALKPYLLEDINLEGFDNKKDIEGKAVIITRENFGCGSSREHAPWAFEVNDINLVIAPSFARIYKRNMFNCGMMAVELPAETIDQIFSVFSNHDTDLETVFNDGLFILTAANIMESFEFRISGFDRALVEAGGWVDYADSKY